jgi:DnaJ-like protein
VSYARWRTSLDRMPLVARVLEMLWAAEQSLDLDLGLWSWQAQEREPKQERAPASASAAKSGDGENEAEPPPRPSVGASAWPGAGRWKGGDESAGGRPAGSYARGWRLGRRSRRPRPRPASGAAPASAIEPALRRCYVDLGVQVGAGLDVVRSAWRQLVREHHPDRHGGDPERQRRGTERLQEINRSYDRLKRWLRPSG